MWFELIIFLISCQSLTTSFPQNGSRIFKPWNYKILHEHISYVWRTTQDPGSGLQIEISCQLNLAGTYKEIFYKFKYAPSKNKFTETMNMKSIHILFKTRIIAECLIHISVDVNFPCSLKNHVTDQFSQLKAEYWCDSWFCQVARCKCTNLSKFCQPSEQIYALFS